MKAVALFLLFIGSLLIIQGYYSYKKTCKKNKVEIKYVPRQLYEDQLSDQESLSIFYKNMFEEESIKI
jgi:hypothetical protein